MGVFMGLLLDEDRKLKIEDRKLKIEDRKLKIEDRKLKIECLDFRSSIFDDGLDCCILVDAGSYAVVLEVT
jgi:hypothetical protein